MLAVTLTVLLVDNVTEGHRVGLTEPDVDTVTVEHVVGLTVTMTDRD